MPGGMTGFDLARWAQQHMPAVAYLLTSGFAEDVARAGEAGPALDILRKPYTGEDLARCAPRRARWAGRVAPLEQGWRRA